MVFPLYLSLSKISIVQHLLAEYYNNNNMWKNIEKGKPRSLKYIITPRQTANGKCDPLRVSFSRVPYTTMEISSNFAGQTSRARIFSRLTFY